MNTKAFLQRTTQRGLILKQLNVYHLITYNFRLWHTTRSDAVVVTTTVTKSIIMMRARAKILSSRFPLSTTSTINCPRKVSSMKGSISGLRADGQSIVMISSITISPISTLLTTGSRITLFFRTSFYLRCFRLFSTAIAIISARIRMVLPEVWRPMRTESSCISQTRAMPSFAPASWTISSSLVQVPGYQDYPNWSLSLCSLPHFHFLVSWQCWTISLSTLSFCPTPSKLRSTRATISEMSAESL